MSGPTNLKELFIHTLKDLYYAENQLHKALKTMISKASSADLKDNFTLHRKETETHISRLEDVFKTVDVKPEGEKCPAIDGIITEAEDLIDEIKDDETRDAAMIAAAQAAEHYEIARYGALISWAKRLEMNDAKDILRDTIAEEKDADSKLTRLAEDGLNKQAMK